MNDALLAVVHAGYLSLAVSNMLSWHSSSDRTDSVFVTSADGGVSTTPADIYLFACVALAFGLYLYGALQDAFSSCRSCAGARPGAPPSLLWRSALVLIGEFLFQLLRHAGWASSVTIVSSAGFARPVYPLRYVMWAATNALIVSNAAAVLRMPAAGSFAACVSMGACLLAVIPLELYPTSSFVWSFSMVASCYLQLLCFVIIGSSVVHLFRLASRVAAFGLAALLLSTLASYAAFPAVFLSARVCGGGRRDEPGSCLSVEDEHLELR
jgi:hypothetical protein